MRLTDQTITDIKNRIDIAEVVGHFIQLKKNVACCPFHDEKSGSFHVHPAKNIFKCFGCGEGGDGIAFVMKHEKKSYVEAMEWLASFYKVSVEYDKSYDPEKDQEKKDQVAELRGVVKFAYDKYVANLQTSGEALEYLSERPLSSKAIAEWGLGFAPDDWRFITPSLVNMGKLNTAVEAGISVSKEGKNFDFYRNRIIIPIHDKDGQLCGIAGRIMPTEVGSAKYFNPVESPIYHKSQVWFGLYQALTARAFKTHDFAYIVEGYFDVIALHEAGCTNTVAACGTAIPDEQFKILLRYTKHFVFMLDGDKAGLEKAMKHIDTALRLGAKVDVVELPDNMDPADYVHKMNALPVEEMEEVEMEEV